MQNIEKTIQSILKKLEVKDIYEKRKLVFWYDKDRTLKDEEELEQVKRCADTPNRSRAAGHDVPSLNVSFACNLPILL